MRGSLIKTTLLLWMFFGYFQLIGQDISLKKSLPADSLLELGQYYDRAFLLDSSIFFYELAADALLEQSDTAAYLSTKVTIADIYGVMAEFKKAHYLLDSVSLVEVGKQESKPRFEAMNIKSYLLIAQRNFNEAFLYLDSAKRFNYQKQTKEGRMRQARISLMGAFTNLQLNQLTEAEGLFETSRHIYDSLQMNFELAEVLNHYGTLKVNLFKADEAISYFNRAEEIYTNRPDTSPTILASLYTSIAQAYVFLGLMPNAITSFEKANVLLSNLELNHQNLTVLNTELAKAYTLMGEFEKGLEAIEKGLALSKLYFGERELWTLRAQYNLGLILKELSQNDKAISVLSEGISLLEGNPSNNFMDMLSLYTYELGEAYFDSGEEEKGLEQIKMSISISLRSGTDFERSTIGIYQGLANLYLRLNEPDSAVTYFQKSLSLSLSNKRTGNSVANAQKVYHEKIYQSLMGKVVAFEMKYNSNKKRYWLDSAYKMLVSAEEKMGTFREFPNSFVEKLEIGSSISSSLHTGINICHELFELTGEKLYADHAYKLIEKSKSSQAFFDFPIENQALGNALDSVIVLEKNLNASISSYETLLYQELSKIESDSLKSAEYRQKITDLTDRLILLRYEIRQKHPSYFQLKYNRDYLTIDQVQSRLLEGNDQLLNYSFGADQIFIFQIEKNSFNFKKIDLTDGLQKNLEVFIRALNEPQTDKRSLNQYREVSEELAKELIPNLDLLLPESSLIIIPDGSLHLIPFGVLTKKNSENSTNFNSLDYLIRHHNIEYCTSSTTLAYQSQFSLNNRGLVAFAPSFSKTSTGTDSIRASLGNLANTKREVENITTYFDTDSFLDSTATEKKFRERVSNYSVIHLASHGIVNSNNSLFSRLLFAPYDTDSINDGLLNTQEILSMNIPAEMVVLSACNTGYGELIAGEGVMSLANGFFYAGAKSVVMTLWTANDESTANIMGKFYQGLSEGETKSQALRAAKLEYLENANSLSAHPYYWAHFVVNGDDSPIVKAGLAWYYWVIILILAVGALRLVMTQRKTTS